MSDNPTLHRPSVIELLLIFGRIGLTSFGGGLSGWFFREFVQDRKWLTEEEFLNGLALSQALPGVNVTNMAIWIGYRLRGGMGAIAGLAGIVVPSALFIVLLAELFAALTTFQLTHFALQGAAAAAIGLSLSMGLTTARRVRRGILPIAVMIATFAAIAIFHLPLIFVVLIGSPISILLALIEKA